MRSLLEVLRSEGVRHVFGNPGSTELPLIDALADAGDLHYVLALQEATATAMADGYAQATGRPSFLNLHTSAGLGNAVGNLTNAKANGAPIVVTAGQQDERQLAADPLLSGPLVELAAPDLQVEPRGPQPGRAGHDPAAGVPGRGQAADRAGVHLAAHGPARAERRRRRGGRPAAVHHRHRLRRPAASRSWPTCSSGRASGGSAIVLGDEVATAGAQAASPRRWPRPSARRCSARPCTAARCSTPRHPLWAGMLAPSAAAIRAALEPFERVLLVGGQAFMVYPYSPGPPVPEGTELLHLSPDPLPLARAHPVRLGVAGGVAASLRALGCRWWPSGPTAAAASDAVAEAADAAGATRSSAWRPPPRERYGAGADAPAGGRPRPRPVPAAGHRRGRRGHHHRRVRPGLPPPGRRGRLLLLQGRRAGLGHAGGLRRVAGPRRCTGAVRRRRRLGDVLPAGAVDRSPGGAPVVFAVVDNGQYRILKDYLRGMGGDSVRTGTLRRHGPRAAGRLRRPRHLDGRAGHAARPAPHDIGDAVRAAVDAGGPHLLHIPITG